jgi:hypothetical protein
MGCKMVALSNIYLLSNFCLKKLILNQAIFINMIDSYIQIWEGREWEKYIQRLLKKHHGQGDYQEMPSKHGGDFGLEGYSIEKGYAYQCYAAEEPISTKERYDKQRDKINTDINKFCNNKAKLEKLFGKIKISRWFLVVPIYDSSQLALYSSNKTEEILQKKLPYVSDDFKIMIINETYFEKEIRELTTLGILELDPNLLNISIEPEEIQLWSDGNSELFNKLENKSKKIDKLVENNKTEEFNKNICLGYLKGQQFLSEFNKKYPELYVKIQVCKKNYEDNLILQSLLNVNSSNSHIKATLNEYSNQLEKEVPHLSPSCITILTNEALADWLMRCPLEI